MESTTLITGIDIGGSHITAGMVDMQQRTVVNNFFVRQRVNCHASANEILNNWCAVVRETWTKSGVAAAPLGFAMPGPFDYENGICLIKGLDKYEALYEMNIREALAERLNVDREQIRFRNDAEAFLEGELFCGAAQGFNHAIGITLGTGLGSAYSHDGGTCDAELSITPYKGEIIEEFVSTRGLIRNYEQLTGRQMMDGKAIAELYAMDGAARKSFASFTNDLTWFLQLFIQQENPEVLVVGGNIVQGWNLFMPQVIQQLGMQLSTLPVIRKAMLGENGILIGGACCFYKPKIAQVQALVSAKNNS